MNRYKRKRDKGFSTVEKINLAIISAFLSSFCSLPLKYEI